MANNDPVAQFGTYAQVETQAREKAQREGVDVHIYRTKSGRFTLVKPAPEGVRKVEPHNTIAAPTAPAMADERETAQWYTADSSGQGKRVIDALPEAIVKRCYKFGCVAAWNLLPVEAREALRRTLYENRITCYNHGKNYDPACPTCKEITEALFYALPTHQPTGDEPECCNPASATSEANREQEQRNLAIEIANAPVKAFHDGIPYSTLNNRQTWNVGQLSPAPGTFVDLPQRIQRHWGDGADEKNRAILELDAATANVANLAQVFCDRSGGILDGERLGALRDACKDRRAKQEAFLRAMANQSPQTDGETFERQGAPTITRGRKMTSYDRS